MSKDDGKINQTLLFNTYTTGTNRNERLNETINTNSVLKGVLIVSLGLGSLSLGYQNCAKIAPNYYNSAHADGYCHEETIDHFRDCGMNIDLTQIENINKIRSMKAFEYDWNGNGGKQFSEDAINLFASIILELKIQPKIAPTGKETLYAQYRKDDGSLLAFNIGKTKVEKVFIPKGDFRHAIEEEYKSDFSKLINRDAENFYGI